MIILDGGLGRQLKAMGAPFRQPEWSALALMEGPEFVRAAHDAFIAGMMPLSRPVPQSSPPTAMLLCHFILARICFAIRLVPCWIWLADWRAMLPMPHRIRYRSPPVCRQCLDHISPINLTLAVPPR